ncbi:unnamed protein product [Symbiodinium pilosum]|uniref:Crossover junction endonuclease MUS81-like HHH domain-containing protein n=1 Tax=Symbiodinium pilosum TaxID=2952 RepID=A0A812T341_SYMPI|nr:unnamed protein product [Symbiodinium pilosum]
MGGALCCDDTGSASPRLQSTAAFDEWSRATGSANKVKTKPSDPWQSALAAKNMPQIPKVSRSCFVCYTCAATDKVRKGGDLEAPGAKSRRWEKSGVRSMPGQERISEKWQTLVARGPIATAATSTPEKTTEKQKEKRAGSPLEKQPAKAAKVQKKTLDRTGPNEELAALFDELASFEFKKGGTSKFAGAAFKKVAATLRGLEKVTTGKSLASLKGVGKESVKKIDQYLETGKIDKLEKYRSGEE